jgi:mannose-1-phosphate guanylyltransferase
VAWLTSRLVALGFSVEVLGHDRGRPLVIAHRAARGLDGHLVLYGHYDVTPFGREQQWTHPPRELTVADGRLFAYATDDYWIDTGKPDLYLQANLDLVTGVRPGHACEPVAPGAFVDPSSTLIDSVVDHGATIAAGAHVDHSVVLAGAMIEANARVVRSSVMGRVEQGASIIDCVIGADGVVAAGEHLEGIRRPAP